MSRFDLFCCEHFLPVLIVKRFPHNPECLPEKKIRFSTFTSRLQCKIAMHEIAVIVKNRFSEEAFKIFRGITGKLFKVFDKMGLVKEIIFVADFSQRFCFVQIFKNSIEAND